MQRRRARGGASRAVLGAAVGAGISFFFDPAQGRRRRTLLQQGVARRVRDTIELAGKARRDLAHRTSGFFAELRAARAEAPVGDRVLRDRVRARIGRVVANPGDIVVEARDGCVVLRGRIYESERNDLVSEAAGVRGVRSVAAELDARAGEAPIPPSARQRGGFLRTPLARLLLGGAASVAVVWLAARARWGVPVLAVGAAALATRSGAAPRILGGAATRGEGRGARRSASGRGGQSMATRIEDLMTRDVVSLQPDATAQQAARLMKERDIGDVLVCEGDTLRGIVTDRDLVVRCLAEDDRPAERRVGEICSSEPVTLSPDDDLDRAVDLMRQHAVRRIPVVDGGRPIGVVSIGDLAMERDERSALADISAAPANQ